MSYLPFNTVTYNRSFVPLGGINCAIYLSTLLYRYREWSVREGWMLLNVEPIQHITGLTSEEQSVVRASLRKIGVIRDGMAFDEPALYVDLDKLNTLLEERVSE